MSEADMVRRREYIREVRKSFDEPEQEETEEHGMPSGWLSLKIRLVLALCLMSGFLIARQNAYEILGYQAKDLVDIISDNYYYTILQDYVMIDERG